MKSEHSAFLAKYLSEKNRKKQLASMKDYLLSLSASDLEGFIDEQLQAVKSYAAEEKLSVSERKDLIGEFDKMIELLSGKNAVSIS